MYKVSFGASEIFQFAIRIEENGEKFYRKVADLSDDTNLKNLFTFLADEEAKHKQTFGELLSKIEKYEPPEAYPDEYFAYLRAYADQIVFPSMIDKELDKKMNSVSAVEFGIRRELDSILYYLEVKNLVPETQRHLIDSIIDEERSHFLKLSNLWKTLQGE